MRKLSLIAASFVALGWSAANAETGSTTVTTPGATIKAPAGSTTSITGPNDTTAPGATVTAPSGATTTITPPSSDTTTATPAAPSDTTTAAPSDTTTATPGETPQPPTTNVEINTPPATNNTVVTPVPVQPAPAPVQDNRYVERTYGPQHYAPAVGAGILVGGGFQDFVGNGIKNVTGDGGYWTARVVAGTREYLGMEAAYVGDARSISGLGFNSDSRLISNGVEGNLRVNIPVVFSNGAALLEPFGFGGVGWAHYQITNNNATLSSFTSSDDVLTVPYGGGLEFAYRGFMADARFTYRQTFFNNLTSTVGGNLNNWGAGGQIGFEF